MTTFSSFLAQQTFCFTNSTSMNKSSSKMLRLLVTAILLLLLASPGTPQDKIYGSVHSLDENKAVSKTEVRTDTGVSDITSDSGKFGLPLVPPLKPGFPVVFTVEGWAVVDPCVHGRGRTYLPDPKAVGIAITALRLGDRQLLASRDSVRCILIQKASHFPNRPLPPTGLKATVSSNMPRNGESPEPKAHGPEGKTSGQMMFLRASYQTVANDSSDDETADFLRDQAAVLGANPEELSQAITDWSKAATDPYDQGLAAFYERRFADASRLITESIDTEPKGPIERYVTLARTEFEQKHYDNARSALEPVLKQHPDDPLLLVDLYVINQAAQPGS
jgi:hypothetical protein